MNAKAIDIAGKKFGKLTAVSRAENRPNSRAAFWLCKCDCGNESVVLGALLRTGRTRSCGCLWGQHQITHGMTNTPEHTNWIQMKQRCLNPNNHAYKNYGGRGIYVCDAWENSFQQFLLDMGRRPSSSHQLDRTDNDGPYSPENCRWVTQRENLQNKRSNHRVTLDGKDVCVSEAAISLGISPSSVTYRIKKGLPLIKGWLRG